MDHPAVDLIIFKSIPLARAVDVAACFVLCEVYSSPTPLSLSIDLIHLLQDCVVAASNGFLEVINRLLRSLLRVEAKYLSRNDATHIFGFSLN